MTPTHCPRCRAARTMRPDMDGAPACVACGYVHVEHIDRTDPADQTHPRHLDARYIREARAHDYTAAPDRGDTYARAQVAQQTRRAEERRQLAEARAAQLPTRTTPPPTSQATDSRGRALQALERAGLSQGELARRAGVSHGYLSMIINYSRRPSARITARLTAVLPDFPTS